MIRLTILAALVTLGLGDGPLYIDELEDLVTNRQDRRELDELDNDDYTTRYMLKNQLDTIISRQPVEIQVTKLLDYVLFDQNEVYLF
uniref:Short neuropeptide F n=1 Tax=Heterorhabditis bacteriophora TaxID=37862 RepID=A0A1I7XBQ1_HETBA